MKGWVDDEAASHLYKRAQDLFEETRKVPSRNAFRQQLIDAHERAQFRAAQPGRLAGFGENLLVAQVLADAAAETRRQKELADTTRRLTSCQQLADDLGVSIDQVREAAQSKLDALDLTPAEVARARQVLAQDTTPGATPAERELERIVSEAEAGQGTAGVGLNLFGEVQAIPQEVEPEKHWLDPDYVGPPPVVTAQSTMGSGVRD